MIGSSTRERREYLKYRRLAYLTTSPLPLPPLHPAPPRPFYSDRKKPRTLRGKSSARTGENKKWRCINASTTNRKPTAIPPVSAYPPYEPASGWPAARPGLLLGARAGRTLSTYSDAKNTNFASELYTEKRKRIKDTRDMFIVLSIHTRHALADARTHSDRVSTSPTFHETLFLTHVQVSTQRILHTYIHTYTRIRVHIREYTKMGNITRYLGVARVHVSLQRRGRDLLPSSLASRIPDNLRWCEISMIDAKIRRRYIRVHLCPAIVVDLTGEGGTPWRRDAVWRTPWARATRDVSRSMIIITIINYYNHYQSVDDDERSNDGTKMPTRQHIFSSVSVKLPNAKWQKKKLIIYYLNST